MKPNYKNWVPAGMVAGFWTGTVIAFVSAGVFAALGFAKGLKWAVVLFAVFAFVGAVLCVIGAFMQTWHNAFSYNGKRKMSKGIVEGIAEYLYLPEGGACLDVGCGSGALTIAIAKRNPKCKIVGCDRWGLDYASFSKTLCENNARAEGVENVSFEAGDACKLPYPDERFDAITSNYVYHNIPSKDRQSILLESLRTLKKGGTFVIHDLFTKQKYGDMQGFIKKLKDLGYEKAELIDTTKGVFMSESEAKRLFLSGSAILLGKK